MKSFTILCKIVLLVTFEVSKMKKDKLFHVAWYEASRVLTTITETRIAILCFHPHLIRANREKHYVCCQFKQHVNFTVSLHLYVYIVQLSLIHISSYIQSLQLISLKQTIQQSQLFRTIRARLATNLDSQVTIQVTRNTVWHMADNHQPNYVSASHLHD